LTTIRRREGIAVIEDKSVLFPLTLSIKCVDPEGTGDDSDRDGA